MERARVFENRVLNNISNKMRDGPKGLEKSCIIK
jgi:hypothetical protein